MKQVYFIRPVGMQGPIKIGCSAAPERRRDSLSTWSPFELEIIAEIDGDEAIERRFHALFLDQHLRREWFHWSERLQATIDEINAGTFAVNTLPPPICVSIITRRKGSQDSRKQAGYSLRVKCALERTGYRCQVSPRGMFKNNDLERIAMVDAYLEDPVLHGVPDRFYLRLLAERGPVKRRRRASSRERAA